MKIRTAIITALLATLFSLNALACGDSLHRVGKGVAYRTYSAPLPGNLLIYATSERAKQLAEELTMSGHTVRLVVSSAELVAELNNGTYDVVIAPFSEHTAIKSTAGTAFLPIAASREEEKQAKASYDYVMSADKHKTKHYLKAIHRTLTSGA